MTKLPEKTRLTKVLFVCVGNTCRSQIAEALARQLASDVVEPSSAGISPFGRIVDATRKVLLERGIRLDGQFSKGLEEANAAFADLIVNMTGIPGESLFPHARVVDWDVGDPYGEDLSVYRQVLSDIEEKVLDLAASLKAKE